MDSIFITTDIMTADTGLDWLGDDPKHYDPLDRDASFDAGCDDEDLDELIDDGDNGFDATGDRFPFE